ncbi:MAG: hypothetical protein OWU84_14655 [Firmicutes bacterium]|nr:hypothetical protein [Bacillota bacterium]
MNEEHSGHLRNNRRSLWLHQAIAEKLRETPDVVLAKAKEEIGWLRQDPHTRWYAEQWEALCTLPVTELAVKISEDSEEMAVLRQCTPFVGVLSPAERWAIYRAFRKGEETG